MILVCVTEQKSSRRLIEAGRRLADKADVPLKVICVRSPEHKNWLASEEVEILFDISKNLSAEMIVKFSNQASEAVSAYIDSQPVQVILVGIPPKSSPSPFIQELESNHPDVPLIQVDLSGKLKQPLTSKCDSR